MYIVLIAIHIIICIILIATILLQAGRGGGLTEAFGGETAQQVFGSQAPIILKRATEVSAILFLVTSLLLGMVTARRGRSLFAGADLSRTQQAMPTGTSTKAAQPVAPVKTPVKAE